MIANATLKPQALCLGRGRFHGHLSAVFASAKNQHDIRRLFQFRQGRQTPLAQCRLAIWIDRYDPISRIL